ncbi:SDR family NAD(P)-dependent oxidoreductase [Cryptosporangium aurantiacum]|uniref:NAD(P)-dependent dehydrogenase, short-chain alcohol dehydrogenase family n=1 Tax=Cryptosporangium aurantiacum TaxID=134849 RepID=A0A1M7KKY4_9ACTN|nr:SDR family NAD(P)-dependent oxidoreductase [Cryptosporangium aurantiacum]SHM66036.1 NAD(P)-dependent dehydrogenase, short-chain alcohol dehydrogenase family [Cryptosporangium aurantiacum]
MSTRVAVVTGGGSGIGEAISRRLAADGSPVAVLDLDGDAATSTAASIEEDGGKALGLAVDVTDRSAVDAAVSEVSARLGRPAILVNNAGVSAVGSFLDVTLDAWNRLLEVNLTGTFHCCQATLPGMIEDGWGRIVNISSSSIHSGSAGMSGYVAAKSGVVGLTKVLALEFSKHGITVNTIPPGFIDTPMLRQTVEKGFVDLAAQTARTPVGRVGRPEDIAAATAFLVSEEAGYITGQILGVNGGRNT